MKGNVVQTLWLSLNLLDTLRALRIVRQNGRRIGVTTRRRLMRQCLTSWIVFVTAEPVTLVCDRVLYWVPFYTSIKQLALLLSIVWRTETSGWLFEKLLVPSVRRYEKHIDLTLLLVGLLCSVLYHFLLDLPIQFLRQRGQALGLWSSAAPQYAQDGDAPSMDDSPESANDLEHTAQVPSDPNGDVEDPKPAPPVVQHKAKPLASAPRRPLGPPKASSTASGPVRPRVVSDTAPAGVRRVVSGSSSSQTAPRQPSHLKAPAQRLQRLEVPRAPPVDLPRLPSVPTHDPSSRPPARPPPPSTRSINVPRTKRVVSGDVVKPPSGESSTEPSLTDEAAEKKPAPKPKPAVKPAKSSDKTSVRASTRKTAPKSPAAKKTTKAPTAPTRTRPKRAAAPTQDEDTTATGAKRTRASTTATTDLPSSKRVRR
ncbi:hypothetical protein Q8F55_005737 [Vanrija albida]|uniref:Uncharacterized protein n=1 Tax=Vanrija albida TaxID=181172 RepID=A0ABR3Q2F6_9TREE